MVYSTSRYSQTDTVYLIEFRNRHHWHDSVPFQLVADEGGFDIVCQDRRWTKIAVQMGFSPGKAVGSHLRGHYERILYPYNLFQSGTNLLVSCTHVSAWQQSAVIIWNDAVCEKCVKKTNKRNEQNPNRCAKDFCVICFGEKYTVWYRFFKIILNSAFLSFWFVTKSVDI